MCIDFYYQYLINIIPALHSWKPQRRLQLLTPFHLLLFMSFLLWYFFIFCHPPYTIDLPSIAPYWFSFWACDACLRQETGNICKSFSVEYFITLFAGRPQHTAKQCSLFWILTLHLSGPSTLCLDINIYWRRTIPHRHVVCRGGGSDRRPRTRGQEFCLWTVFFVFFFFFLIGKGSGDSWGSAGFKEVHSWVLDSHKWRGVWLEGAKGGKNAEENRLVGVTCRGGFIAVETVNALLERHSQNWSGKSMLQAHELNCLITGVKNFTVI